MTITDAGGLSTTSNVDATVNQTLTMITDSPSSASLNLNGTQSFSAVGYDQFGAALLVQPSFSWSIASVSSRLDRQLGTLYTAGTVAGSATVSAASGAVIWQCIGPGDQCGTDGGHTRRGNAQPGHRHIHKPLRPRRRRRW